MVILGIETSCDETSASVLEINKDNKIKLHSNIISSSMDIHANSGGIIPENAAREQTKVIIPVINQALKKANKKINEIDKIAVTYGPGLIGSLLVGVETAKTISLATGIEIIPVNHLIGHIYANFIENSEKIKFPLIGLIVSGGHTDLILIKSHNEIEWLGGTFDDAAGEALDKIGRVMKLPYPGGPYIEKAAKLGNPNNFKLPSPLLHTKDFNFSFSGLKAAAIREIEKINLNDEKSINDISASVQEAVTKVLIKKTIIAVKKYNAKSLLLGGGVSANQALRIGFEQEIYNSDLNVSLFVPEKQFCTDNAAMIAVAGYFNSNEVNWKDINADPGLYFDLT